MVQKRWLVVVLALILTLVLLHPVAALSCQKKFDPVTRKFTFPPGCDGDGNPDPTSQDFWNNANTEDIRALTPEQISANWNFAQAHQAILQEHHVNGLTTDQRQDLTDEGAIQHIAPSHAPDITSEQVGIVGLDGFSDAVRGNLQASAIQAHLTQDTADIQASLNQEELSTAISNLIGTQVNVNLGPNGIGGEVTETGFNFEQAESLQVGQTILTQGANVTFTNGTLTAQSAETFIRGTTILTLVEEISDQSTEFYVESAEQVQADCITINNITKTTFRDTSLLSLTMQEGVTAKINDCADHPGHFEALAENAVLTISKDPFQPVYLAQNVTLDFTLEFDWGIAHENISGLGFAFFNLTRDLGISSLFGTEAVEYIYQGEDPDQIWKFRGKEDIFALHTRKQVNQPNQFNCTSCAIFDLIDHEITIKGLVQVLKKPIKDNQLFDNRFTDVITHFNIGAHTALFLDQENAEVLEQHIVKNAPRQFSHPSTYLTLQEHPFEGKTISFLGLNTNPDVSDSMILAYRTAYQPALIGITNNHLTYKSNNCQIEALNPEEVNDAIASMQGWRS